MKIGLIVNGSGLHGAFACGALKKLLDENIHIDHVVATGFGALAGAYYRAGQGSGLESLYGNFCEAHTEALRRYGNIKGEERMVDGLQLLESAEALDMDAYNAAAGRFVVATTRSDNGDGVFWPLERYTEWKHLKQFLTAAVSFPGAAEPVSLVERSYFDGRIAEPLPITAALEQGCDRLIVVQTKMANAVMKHPVLTPGQALALKNYPKLRNVYLFSHLQYNNDMLRLQELQSQGKAVVVAPLANSASYHRYGVSASAASEFYTEGMRLCDKALDRIKALVEANN